jgi:hypothetical protein
MNKPVKLPTDGEVFKLTLDPVLPMQMLKQDGYSSSAWQYKGVAITESQTRKFKLERTGHELVSSFTGINDVINYLIRPGEKPAAGQWREAFSKAFPQNSGEDGIGFLDPSWFNDEGLAYFPVLVRPLLGPANERMGWESRFVQVDPFDLYADIRWLVEVMLP